jgi:dihydropyrimidinase
MLGGTAASFRVVPNGIPGLETRLPPLFSEEVGKGRIDLQASVAPTSTNPARMCGKKRAARFPCADTVEKKT